MENTTETVQPTLQVQMIRCPLCTTPKFFGINDVIPEYVSCPNNGFIAMSLDDIEIPRCQHFDTDRYLTTGLEVEVLTLVVPPVIPLSAEFMARQRARDLGEFGNLAKSVWSFHTATDLEVM